MELIIVVAIVPVVVGTITLATIVFSSLQSSVTDRVGATTDSQVTASVFYKDVEGATMFTTAVNPLIPSPGSCGTGTRLVAFTYGGTPVEVSYNLTTLGTTTQFGVQEYQLTRYQCTIPSLPVTSTTVLSARAAGAPAATVTVGGTSCLQSTPSSCYYGIWGESWVPTIGVTSITLAVDEAATNTKSVDAVQNGDTCTVTGMTYCFSVEAVPRDWSLIQTNLGQLTGTTVPAQFLGNTSSACSSNNPFMAVNGTLLLDYQGAGSSFSGNKSNIYASPVEYVNGTAPSSPPLGSGVTTNPASYVPDPLAGLATPDFSGLPTYTSMASAVSKTVTSGGITYEYVGPGTYTIPLAPLNSGDTLVLLSGEYNLVGGLGAGQSGTIQSGPGGTLIYLPGNAPVDATNMNLTLTPLTSGPYSGLSMWVPSESITLGPNNNEIGGILYEPTGTFTLDGNAKTWVGTLLSYGMNCNGGGTAHGQLNIGYSQSVSITSAAPSTSQVVIGQTYNVTAQDTATPDLTGTQPTLTPVFSIDPLSVACSIVSVVNSGSTATATVEFGPSAGDCLIDVSQPGTTLDTSANPPTGGYAAATPVQEFILVPPASG